MVHKCYDEWESLKSLLKLVNDKPLNLQQKITKMSFNLSQVTQAILNMIFFYIYIFFLCLYIKNI